MKNLLYWVSSLPDCLQLKDPCWPRWEHPTFLLTQFDPSTGLCILNPDWLGLQPQKKKKSLISWAPGLTHSTGMWCHTQTTLYSPVCVPGPLGADLALSSSHLPQTMWEGMTPSHLCVNHFFKWNSIAWWFRELCFSGICAEWPVFHTFSPSQKKRGLPVCI